MLDQKTSIWGALQLELNISLKVCQRTVPFYLKITGNANVTKAAQIP